MNSHFESYIQYKTLAHRFDPCNAGIGIDQALSMFANSDVTDQDGNPVNGAEELEKRMQLQNVCAKIPVRIVKELEATLSILSMSKREFIEIAIVSAIQETHSIFEQNGVEVPQVIEEESAE